MLTAELRPNVKYISPSRTCSASWACAHRTSPHSHCMQHAYVLFTVGDLCQLMKLIDLNIPCFHFFAALMFNHNRLARLIPNGYAVIIHSDRAVCVPIPSTRFTSSHRDSSPSSHMICCVHFVRFLVSRLVCAAIVGHYIFPVHIGRQARLWKIILNARNSMIYV